MPAGPQEPERPSEQDERRDLPERQEQRGSVFRSEEIEQKA